LSADLRVASEVILESEVAPEIADKQQGLMKCIPFLLEVSSSNIFCVVEFLLVRFGGPRFPLALQARPSRHSKMALRTGPLFCHAFGMSQSGGSSQLFLRFPFPLGFVVLLHGLSISCSIFLLTFLIGSLGFYLLLRTLSTSHSTFLNSLIVLDVDYAIE